MSAAPRFLLICLACAALTLVGTSEARGQTTTELDAYWAEVSRTVAAGDFEGYARLYHPDAVLVALGSGASYPISQALAGWESGFNDTRDEKAESSVAFRLTQRLHDGTSAHETGMFKYTLKPEGGVETGSIVHFEALLVKKDGVWLMVMEYQKHVATEEEWQAAGGRRDSAQIETRAVR